MLSSSASRVEQHLYPQQFFTSRIILLAEWHHIRCQTTSHDTEKEVSQPFTCLLAGQLTELSQQDPHDAFYGQCERGSGFESTLLSSRNRLETDDSISSMDLQLQGDSIHAGADPKQALAQQPLTLEICSVK